MNNVDRWVDGINRTNAIAKRWKSMISNLVVEYQSKNNLSNKQMVDELKLPNKKDYIKLIKQNLTISSDLFLKLSDKVPFIYLYFLSRDAQSNLFSALMVDKARRRSS